MYIEFFYFLWNSVLMSQANIVIKWQTNHQVMRVLLEWYCIWYTFVLIMLLKTLKLIFLSYFTFYHMWRRCLQWIPDDLFRFLQSHQILLTIHSSNWDFIFLALEIKVMRRRAKREYRVLRPDETTLHHFFWCRHKQDLEI